MSDPPSTGDSLEGTPDTAPLAQGGTEHQTGATRPSTGRVLAQASLILTVAALASRALGWLIMTWPRMGGFW